MSIDIDLQIACVRREISMRRKVYPRWVSTGKMTQNEAARQISTMEAVQATLEQLRYERQAHSGAGAVLRPQRAYEPDPTAMTMPEAAALLPAVGARLDRRVVPHRAVAALFCRAGSVYKSLPGVDVWDEARDARGWPGGVPLVAHPPCRLWAKLRQFAKAKDPAMERQLAIDAVRRVQRFGGVLEHPAESMLWAHEGLPTPGRAPDKHGGWTAEVNQCDWGHKAEKRTWLYIVGCHPDDLPQMPQPGKATGLIKPKRGQPRDGRKIVTKAEREHTPPAFAAWLVELARRCQVRHNVAGNRLAEGKSELTGLLGGPTRSEKE